jgi:hypothetical protein
VFIGMVLATVLIGQDSVQTCGMEFGRWVCRTTDNRPPAQASVTDSMSSTFDMLSRMAPRRPEQREEPQAAPAYELQTATAPPEINLGSDVVRVCRSPTARDVAFCEAYIAGVHDAALDIYDSLGQPVRYCLPDRISIQQVARGVTARISAEPRLYSARPGGAVVASMIALYPCGFGS